MPKKERILFTPVPPVWKVRDIIEKLGGVGILTEQFVVNEKLHRHDATGSISDDLSDDANGAAETGTA